MGTRTLRTLDRRRAWPGRETSVKLKAAWEPSGADRGSQAASPKENGASVEAPLTTGPRSARGGDDPRLVHAAGFDQPPGRLLGGSTVGEGAEHHAIDLVAALGHRHHAGRESGRPAELVAFLVGARLVEERADGDCE